MSIFLKSLLFEKISVKKQAYSSLFESNYARDTQWPKRKSSMNDEKEKTSMSSKNSNRINVPEARAAMDKFKMEAAAEVDVPSSY